MVEGIRIILFRELKFVVGGNVGCFEIGYCIDLFYLVLWVKF